MTWSRDSGCSGLFEPSPPREGDFSSEDEFNDAFTDYLEDWFDWWGGCIEGGPELPEEPPDPPEPPEPPPPPCIPARWIVNGMCWERICTLDGPVVRPCFRHPFDGVFPRIESIKLTAGGVYANIAPAPEEDVIVEPVLTQEVNPRFVFRAMLHGAQLPASRFSAVESDFWKHQPKLGKLSEFSILDPRGTRFRLLGRKGGQGARRGRKPKGA